jgi:ParB family chromosome partitioning protein
MNMDSNMEKRSGLGKGLSALFTEKKVDIHSLDEKTSEDSKKVFIELELKRIKVNPYQPREDFDEEKLNELADSIRQKGILQPVTVKVSKAFPGNFDLISGERRLKAAEKAGLLTIPAYIYKTEDDSEENMLELALIENVQRENLNPMELASSYQRLVDECGLTQEQIAEKVSKQRSTIGNFLRLLKLPDEIKASLRKNEISEAHARMLLRIDDKDDQIMLWQRILSESISVRRLEDITKKSTKPRKKKSKGFQDSQFKAIEDKLTMFFGTKVTVKSKTKSRGEIIIEYYSDDDIERIIEKCE